MLELYKFLKTQLIFESLLSNLFGVAGLGIAFGSGRGSVAVCAFTRGGFRGQRSRYLELHFGVTDNLTFPLSFSVTLQAAGKDFSGDRGCEIDPTGCFTEMKALRSKINSKVHHCSDLRRMHCASVQIESDKQSTAPLRTEEEP